MSIIILLSSGFSAAGLFMLIRAAFSAPQGEEDEWGFHFSAPQEMPDASSPSRELTAAELAFFKPVPVK